jgi:hypothetical protein
VVELRSFCKYFGSSPKVLTGIFGNRKIRFTQPWGLNDPLVLAHIDEFGAPEIVLDSPPHHFSALNGDPREEKRTQTIDTLAELPYYGRFRGAVERFRDDTIGARVSRNSQC